MLTTSIPAIKGQFSSRVATYASQISPRDVAHILGHDPSSKNWKNLKSAELRKLYEYLQRATNKQRIDALLEYMEARFGSDPQTVGAFPAISIAFEEPVRFFPLTDSSTAFRNDLMGHIALDPSRAGRRVVVDGLGRLSAAQAVLDMIDGDDLDPDEKEAWRDVIDHVLFPVTFYSPAEDQLPFTREEMGQFFHDFNFRAVAIPARHAIALDQSDLYINLTNELGRRPSIVSRGGMEKRAASLGKKSTALVVQTVLLRFVRGACEGMKFQESNKAAIDEPNLTPETEGEFLDGLDQFIEDVADKMGEARFNDRGSLHRSAPGWQVLGLIYHDLYVRLQLADGQAEAVLDRLVEIDWSRMNPDWVKIGIGKYEYADGSELPVKDENGKHKIAIVGAGRSNRQALYNYALRKTGLDRLLIDAGVTVDLAELETEQ